MGNTSPGGKSGDNTPSGSIVVALTKPKISDDSAFLPASTFYRDHFATYKQFKAWLDRTPESEIRRRKPSKNRLDIHAGDWKKYWDVKAEKTFDGLDNTEPRAIVDMFVEGAKQRAAELRAAKIDQPQGTAPLNALVEQIKAGK
jgi:hypothetical protein